MSNERPVPNTTEGIFLKDNNCNERIYTYLLLKSKFNPNGRETHRYLEKISNIKIAEDLGLNRNTVGTRIKDLERRGYIIKEGKYYLVPKPDYYALIPKDTLDFLLNYIEKKEKIIKLYIVLFDYWNRRKTFSILDLHRELGYSCPNGKPISKNSLYIRELLLILSGAKLIDYQIKEGRNDKGAPIDLYSLLFVRSNLPNCYKDSYKRLVETGEITPEWEQIISEKLR